jgi:hypothetical protein
MEKIIGAFSLGSIHEVSFASQFIDGIFITGKE